MSKTIPTEELLAQTRDAKHSRRLEAVDMLAQRVFRKKDLRADPAVTQVLLDALASEDAMMRYHGSFGLQYIEGSRVTEACIAALKTPAGSSLDTNMQIVARLGKSKDPRALDTLRAVLDDLPKGMPKRTVREAIAKLEAGLAK